MSIKVDIVKNAEFDTTIANGVATLKLKDSDAYTKGSTIEKKVLKEVEDYNKAYVAEATKMATDESIAIMKSNKKVDRVLVEFPFTTSKRGSVAVKSDRKHEYPNPADPKGAKIVKSAISVVVSDPSSAISKSYLRELKAEMTAVLI